MRRAPSSPSTGQQQCACDQDQPPTTNHPGSSGGRSVMRYLNMTDLHYQPVVLKNTVMCHDVLLSPSKDRALLGVVNLSHPVPHWMHLGLLKPAGTCCWSTKNLLVRD